jgi:hypothetical protein
VSNTPQRARGCAPLVAEAKEMLMIKRFLLAFVLLVLCVLVWNLVTNFQPRQ